MSLIVIKVRCLCDTEHLSAQRPSSNQGPKNLLMRLPTLIRNAFVKTLLLTLCVTPVCAQNLKATWQQEQYVVDNETYERVLDLVFPRNTLAGVFGYSFIIRYRPNSEPESQITVINEAGKIEVVEYSPADGNIYEQLNRVFKRTKRQNATYMAKQIRINKRVVDIASSEIKRIRESLYDHICLATRYERQIVNENMETAPLLIDDGTRYALWYRGAGRIHYDLIGSAIARDAEHPLIQWIREVGRMINKLPTAKHFNP
jgi:hypothetical protein